MNVRSSARPTAYRKCRRTMASLYRRTLNSCCVRRSTFEVRSSQEISMYQRLVAIALATILFSPALPAGQGKLPPTPAEWGQFEQLVAQTRGGLSPDGKWLAYGVNRSSRDNDLRIRNIGS